MAKARAYLGALLHIRLVPVFERSSASDNGGMGHLSASRQSVDNLLWLGFSGTIEVIYANNGYTEDAIRDMFPAFPEGGDLTGPAGERVRIDYIPRDPKPGAGRVGFRLRSEAEDVDPLNAKNTDAYPRRLVQLINDWDKGGYGDDRNIAEVLAETRQVMPTLDLDPGGARFIVNLQAFGWDEPGRRFVYDSEKNEGHDLVLGKSRIVSYVRPPAPNPIAEAARQGREQLSSAIRAFTARHPILKDNSPLQVLVAGFEGRTLAIDGRRGTTVAQLKQLVRDRTAIPANHQYLTFNGKVLVDSKVLDEYGVVNGSVIRGNVRGGDVPDDPGDANAAAVTAAPPGKLVDINTTRTMATVLEGAALGTWDLLPGYGFHNAGNQSLDRVALSARQAQATLDRRRPIVFVSMRHPHVPSEALLKDPGFRSIKADDPDAAAALAMLRPDQVAIVIAGGVPGPVFNQLALSATLPILLEGAGTASFAIQEGIPYIALVDNASIVDAPRGASGSDRLREIGKWLSSSRADKDQDGVMVKKLATVMAEAVQPSSEMARYFQALADKVRKPKQQQMAAAFEKLYDMTERKVTIRRACGQKDNATAGEAILFTIVFSKPPAAFGAGDVTLSATDTVDVSAAERQIAPFPLPPEYRDTPIAVAYQLTLRRVSGAGLLTASIANAAVRDTDLVAFPASTGVAPGNTVTLR